MNWRTDRIVPSYERYRSGLSLAGYACVREGVESPCGRLTRINARLTVASGVCAPGIHVRTCDRRLSVHPRTQQSRRAGAMVHRKEELAMTNVVDLGWVPVGYRVASTDADARVECERGCGGRFRVATLTQLRADAREELFRFHDDCHTKRPCPARRGCGRGGSEHRI